MFTRTDFPILIADIGGTNARFSLLQENPRLDIGPIILKTGEFETIETAIAALLDQHSIPHPRAVSFAIAGPLGRPPYQLTNAHWQLKPERIAAHFDLHKILFFNDFEAQALALAGLRDSDKLPIGCKGVEKLNAAGPKIVVGPGTGLGIAALLDIGGKLIPVSGEGGHVELGPLGAEERKIWEILEPGEQRIGAEKLLSGRGIERIARAICILQGKERIYSGAKAVVQAAKEGDGPAKTAMDLFIRLLGRYSGDLALIFMATGGVYLAGGILPKIAEELFASTFRDAFEKKAPHEGLMRTIPTYLVCADTSALSGIAGYIRNPDRFAINAQERYWQAKR